MDSDTPMFTCISCAIAFSEPGMQREHFGSDWHRYNMKRRVAGLPPVAAMSFNQKVMERREQTAVRFDPRDMTCEACKKIFATENAYRSHIASKKHAERDAKYQAAKALQAASAPTPGEGEGEVESGEVPSGTPDVYVAPTSTLTSAPLASASASASGPSASTSKVHFQPTAKDEEEEDQDIAEDAEEEVVDEEEEDSEDEDGITAKLARSRSKISPSDCLFCTHTYPSIPQNLKHMSSVHSFFIPDQEYLTDVSGLLTYLGEKLSIGNTCIYCPNGGKEFGSLEAVRAHMRDKNHCKLAYDTEEDRLEVGDFFNFEESYPDAEVRRQKKIERHKRRMAREVARKKREQREEDEGVVDGEEDWEEMDVDDGKEPDEVVEVEGGDSDEDDSDDESDLSELSDNGMALASDGLSLRLPSGRTLGHRSLKIYYAQNLRPIPTEPLQNSSSAMVLKLKNVRAQLEDPTQALVPVRGGAGGFGRGLQMMKARNAGEAKNAKKIASQGREWRAREAFKTRVGFVHNSQKHFRDPLLQ